MGWGPAEVDLEQIKNWWTIDGLSAGQIAGHFGQSRNVIIGIIHRRGWIKPGGTQRARSTYVRPPAQRPARIDPPKPKRETLVLDPAIFVEIDQLGPHHCRYPVDQKGGEYKGKYCGAMPNGTPYCDGHAAIVYQPSTNKKKIRPRR